MTKLTINYPVTVYQSVEVEVTENELANMLSMGDFEKSVFIYKKHPVPALATALANQSVNIGWETIGHS